MLIGIEFDSSLARVKKINLKELISKGFKEYYTADVLKECPYVEPILDEFLKILPEIIDASAQEDGYVDYEEEFRPIKEKLCFLK